MGIANATDSAPPLLETKLHAQRPRRGLVERLRLNDRLRVETLPTLTIVAAPAGFGKTTVLSDLCTRAVGSDRAAAWLSLDAGDNDPTVFWSYVIAALHAALPARGQDASSLLRSAQPLGSVVASLLNDLATIEGQIVMVLDDYHVIETLEVHQSIVYLVEHLPAHVRLVLGSRADPPLPLARLRARGELLEVRAADLRFSVGEATAYFGRTRRSAARGSSAGPADVPRP